MFEKNKIESFDFYNMANAIFMLVLTGWLVIINKIPILIKILLKNE